MAVSTLALPQVTHYVLDGFIWRLDGTNPQLAEALCGDGPLPTSPSKDGIDNEND